MPEEHRILLCELELGEDRFGDEIRRRVYASHDASRTRLQRILAFQVDGPRGRRWEFLADSEAKLVTGPFWDAVRQVLLDGLDSLNQLESLEDVRVIRCHRSCHNALQNWLEDHNLRSPTEE